MELHAAAQGTIAKIRENPPEDSIPDPRADPRHAPQDPPHTEVTGKLLAPMLKSHLDHLCEEIDRNIASLQKTRREVATILDQKPKRGCRRSIQAQTHIETRRVDRYVLLPDKPKMTSLGAFDRPCLQFVLLEAIRDPKRKGR